MFIKKNVYKIYLEDRRVLQKKRVCYGEKLYIKGMGSSGSTAEPTVKGSKLPINAVYVYLPSATESSSIRFGYVTAINWKSLPVEITRVVTKSHT